MEEILQGFQLEKRGRYFIQNLALAVQGDKEEAKKLLALAKIKADEKMTTKIVRAKPVSRQNP